MGLCWKELDEIKNIYDRLPPNSMIFTPDEIEAFQKHANYESFIINCFVMPTVPYHQTIRLQYLYKPE